MEELNHRGYFSVSRPTSLAYLLDQVIMIPDLSLYHRIIGWKTEIQIHIDFWRVVEKYIILSLSCPTVIDLQMPYNFQNQLYEGRYIFYNGELLGIRLNTVPKCSKFSHWPRNKYQIQKFPIQIKYVSKKRKDFVVGEFTLQFINLRIGLIGEAEVQSLLPAYIEFGFQLIVGHLDRPCKIFVLDSPKNAIQSLYYFDFTDFIQKKQYNRPIFINQIPYQIQIPIVVNTPKDPTLNPQPIQIVTPMQQPHNYHEFSKSQKNFQFEQKLSKYRQRFQLLEKLYSLGNRSKILITLQQNCQNFGFLYLYKNCNANLPIRIIDFGCHQINKLAEKVLKQSKQHKLLSLSNSYKSPLKQVYSYISLIQQLAKELQHSTQLIVLTTNPIYIKMNNTLTKLYNQYHGTKLTIISVNFLSKLQTEEIYNSVEIKQIINSNEYYNRIKNNKFQTFKIDQKFIDLENILYSSVNLQCYPKQIEKQFTKLNLTEFQQKYIFDQFIWSITPSIDLSVSISHFLPSALLSSTSFEYFYKLYKMLTEKSSIQPSKQQQQKIKQIEEIKIQYLKNQVCHKCCFNYPKYLLCICNVKNCNYKFCIKCLKQVYQWNIISKNQNIEQNNNNNNFKNIQNNNKINIYTKINSIKQVYHKQLDGCPICLQKCLNCQKCNELKLLTKVKGKMNKIICHYCKKTPSISIECSSCKQTFCYCCCKQIFDQHNLIGEKWICFICRGNCLCGDCILKKKIQNKIVDDISQVLEGLSYSEKKMLEQCRYAQNKTEKYYQSYSKTDNQNNQTKNYYQKINQYDQTDNKKNHKFNNNNKNRDNNNSYKKYEKYQRFQSNNNNNFHDYNYNDFNNDNNNNNNNNNNNGNNHNNWNNSNNRNNGYANNGNHNRNKKYNNNGYHNGNSKYNNNEGYNNNSENRSNHPWHQYSSHQDKKDDRTKLEFQGQKKQTKSLWQSKNLKPIENEIYSSPKIANLNFDSLMQPQTQEEQNIDY